MTDAKIPKPIPLGKFKPLHADTSLARICAAAEIRQGGRAARGSGCAPAAARPGRGARHRA
jgi:hypothetical protein